MRSEALDVPNLADVEAMVRANVSGAVDAEQHEHGKQRLLAALRQRQSTAASMARRFAVVGGLLAALAGGGVYAWTLHGNAPLGYVVTSGMLSDSGYLRSNGPSGARLSFSDGSRVHLHEGARARLEALDAHSVRLALESGLVALQVAHQPRAAWHVDAGPFVVLVAGTQFDVYWSSYDDTLSVAAYEGTLRVSGPLVPSGVLVREGQRLTAFEGRFSIESLERPELLLP